MGPQHSPPQQPSTDLMLPTPPDTPGSSLAGASVWSSSTSSTANTCSSMPGVDGPSSSGTRSGGMPGVDGPPSGRNAPSSTRSHGMPGVDGPSSGRGGMPGVDGPSSAPSRQPPDAPASVSSSRSASPLLPVRRQLSDNELSYFLPSRADGVNDMYVHHNLRAAPDALSLQRVRLAWALGLHRHPLLASAVELRAYDDAVFAHAPPATLAQALEQGDQRLTFFEAADGPPDLVNAYLNGVRTLSATMPAQLIIRRGTARGTDLSGAWAHEADDGLDNAEVMLCTTHYVGDGMALHSFMNEFYGHLGGERTIDELQALLQAEVDAAVQAGSTALPPSLEDRIPLSRWQRAAGEVAQRSADARLLGGQVLPAVRGAQRHTIVPTRAYSREQTSRALATCKAHGVTIAHAVFALCAVAWGKYAGAGEATEPTMIYSALNLRPLMHLVPARTSASFFHLAVGYFNVVLPSLRPALPPADVVWLRALQTKRQTVAAVKSPLAGATFRATSSARAARSRHWARFDDEAANPGLGLGLRIKDRALPAPAGAEKRDEQARPPPPPPAGKALMGVSMLGNLDGVYKHDAFPRTKLYSLTTGSRQRPGGLLLFAYTFAGKLFLSLGYDANGFKPGVIDAFWADVLRLAEDVVVGAA
ncbi:hypothetical protein Q8F55_000428 [Vanrija albida]|uniref:Condensation domain-containing protein n=1 Tax=Vanrija albida TaxID=181172 RepID=A0ABR3QE81_9TREE